MTAPTQTHASYVTHARQAMTLALSLAEAERAVHTFASGQVDAIIDPDGKVHLLRAAQENLLQSVKRLQAVLDAVPDVITLVNQAGVILSQSRVAGRVFGHSPDPVTGTSIFRRIHEEDVREVYSAFFNVREGFLDRTAVKFRHRTQEGSYRDIEATIGRLSGGNTPGVIFSSRPVGRTMQDEPAETPLSVISSSLLKDRFLAMLSHELRTPLTPALMGIGELQEDERFLEARPVLAMINRNLKLQSRLLDELADFTTIEHHKVHLRLESLDAHKHIGFVLEICRSELEAAKVRVILDLRATKPLVLADSLRLQQVMWNLVKNAVKFAGPDGIISITTVDQGPGLAIAVSDNGIGIEAALLPLVFDPFQQSNDAAQQPSSGLGLGLFIAKGLAEAQGGTLTVLSEGRGRGATFRLTLMAPVPSSDSRPDQMESAR